MYLNPFRREKIIVEISEQHTSEFHLVHIQEPQIMVIGVQTMEVSCNTYVQMYTGIIPLLLHHAHCLHLLIRGHALLQLHGKLKTINPENRMHACMVQLRAYGPVDNFFLS